MNRIKSVERLNLNGFIFNRTTNQIITKNAVYKSMMWYSVGLFSQNCLSKFKAKSNKKTKLKRGKMISKLKSRKYEWRVTKINGCKEGLGI